MHLYQITGSIIAIEDAIIEAGGEITDEIALQLEQMEGALDEKAEAIAAVIRNLSAMADAAKSEEQRIAALRKSRESGADRLKHYLQTCMEAAGRDKIETPVFKIALQKSPPSIGCAVAADDLPDAFVRVIPETREPDKKAMLEAWKRGEALPEGIIVNESRHLRIR